MALDVDEITAPQVHSLSEDLELLPQDRPQTMYGVRPGSAWGGEQGVLRGSVSSPQRPLELCQLQSRG